MTLSRHLVGLCRLSKVSFNVFAPQRCFHQSRPLSAQFMNKLVKPITEDMLRQTDKVTSAFSLIYRAPMDKYILALSIVCSATTIGLACIGFNTYWNDLSLQDLEQRTTWGDKKTVATGKNDLVLFGIGLVGFNIMMSVMIHRYPLRIWKNGTNYIAVFEGHVPTLRRKIPFVKGQVEPVPAKGVLPWKDSRFTINGTKALILDNYFKRPSELHQMVHEKYRYYE